MAAPLIKIDKLNLEKTRKKHDYLQYVVAVDESICSKHAFAWSDFLANPQDKLTIIHAEESDQSVLIANDRYEKYPNQNNKRFSYQILNNTKYSPDQRILHFVNGGQKQCVDMLVTGYYGHTAEQAKHKKIVVGSTSDSSLRSARCSSFFVKRSVEIPEKQDELKIVVGVDGSQNSLHAFEFATKVLESNNTLYVVHIETEYSNNHLVPEQYKSKNVIKNYTNYIKNVKKNLKFDVNMEVILIEDEVNISHGLCEFAKKNKCHILCVGADGMTAHCNSKPILGSVSDECVKDCECNIIVTQINEYNATPRASFDSMRKM